MNKQGISGVKRILNAFQYSLAGLKRCFIDEQAFRQELLLCLILLPVPFCFDFSNSIRGILIFSLFLILIVELLNSGIEAIIDRISLDHHDLSKKAKDIGSAAVLLTIVGSGVLWFFAFLDLFG